MNQGRYAELARGFAGLGESDLYLNPLRPILLRFGPFFIGYAVEKDSTIYDLGEAVVPGIVGLSKGPYYEKRKARSQGNAGTRPQSPSHNLSRAKRVTRPIQLLLSKRTACQRKDEVLRSACQRVPDLS